MLLLWHLRVPINLLPDYRFLLNCLCSESFTLDLWSIPIPPKGIILYYHDNRVSHKSVVSMIGEALGLLGVMTAAVVVLPIQVAVLIYRRYHSRRDQSPIGGNEAVLCSRCQAEKRIH